MKSSITFFVLLVLIFLMSSCCGAGGDDAYEGPPYIHFGIFDSTGVDNLFNWDGPYNQDSLKIYESDNTTLKEFELERNTGRFILDLPLSNSSDEFQENTFYLSFQKNNCIDTLTTVFRFYPGDGKCVEDALGFHKLVYNGEEYYKSDPDWGFIKLVK